MRKILLTTAIVIVGIVFHGCAAIQSEYVLARFGDEDITMAEFEKAYAKNVGGYENAKDDSIADYEKFLDLYVNYRMKLRDAFVRGYYNDPDILNELDTYKRKVGASYIIEKEIIDPGMRKFHEDRKYEMRVSHILIKPDTISLTEAKQLAEDIIKRIKNGESFAKLAEQYSADQFSKNNGGDIYWIYPGIIIPEFAQAAMNTPVGEIYPEPVKTQYGYHIIKVTDRQKRRYKLRASHILVNFQNVNGTVDTTEAYKKINEIRDKLLKGADFAELAKEFSDDRGSAEKGGDLGFFTRRMMVQPFDEAVFNLKIGELSQIVRTRYGYHIIKLIEEQPYPSFEEDKEELKPLYNRIRYDNEYNKFVDSLRKKYNYEVDQKLVNEIVNYPDTVRFTDEYWETDLHKNYGNKAVATINTHPLLVDSVFAYGINETQLKRKVINRNNFFSQALEKHSAVKLLEEAALDLPKVNQEFASLMDDYKNGIYIFKLQEDEVWNEVTVDTTQLEKLYNDNKSKYIWPDRVEFSEIYVYTDSVANKIYNELLNGADFDSVARRETRRPGFRGTTGYHGLKNVENSGLEQTAWELEKPGDISEPFKSGSGWSIVKLIKKEPSRQKTFEEAEPEVISEYQEILTKKLEDDYLNNLKSRYEPVYYYENLKNVFKTTAN